LFEANHGLYKEVLPRPSLFLLRKSFYLIELKLRPVYTSFYAMSSSFTPINAKLAVVLWTQQTLVEVLSNQIKDQLVVDHKELLTQYLQKFPAGERYEQQKELRMYVQKRQEEAEELFLVVHDYIGESSDYELAGISNQEFQEQQQVHYKAAKSIRTSLRRKRNAQTQIKDILVAGSM
jgi:hypothetical protein